MNIRFLTLIVACLAATPLLAQAQPDAVGEQVRRDLGSIFQPGASLEDIANGVDNIAVRGHLRTRPYATSISGICRRDEVLLDYAGPVPQRATTAENTVEPFGVSARSWFRVVREPQLGINRERPFEGECSRLDGAGTRGWFVAPDIYAAADGYRTFSAMIRQLGDPHHRIAGCREGAEARRACLSLLPASAQDQIVSIGRCASVQNHFCYTFGLTDDSSVTVRMRYDGRARVLIDSVEIQGPYILI